MDGPTAGLVASPASTVRQCSGPPHSNHRMVNMIARVLEELTSQVQMQLKMISLFSGIAVMSSVSDRQRGCPQGLKEGRGHFVGLFRHLERLYFDDSRESAEWPFWGSFF